MRDEELYLCSLPFHTSHPHILQTTASSSSSCTHVVTHPPCALLREKHLILLQCAEITVGRRERVGKQGVERKNISEDESLLLLCTCCCTELSELRSFTHARPHTKCYTRDFRKALSLRLIAEIRNDNIRVSGLSFVSEMIECRTQTQAKGM